MTAATTARCLRRRSAFALPRRGHVPPRGAERQEWDEGNAVLEMAPSVVRAYGRTLTFTDELHRRRGTSTRPSARRSIAWRAKIGGMASHPQRTGGVIAAYPLGEVARPRRSS